ncbi:monooxygenase 1 [Zea mays]|uniref:Monooxygenase 1 n=1 Tax=Zea mays TaxID=4577 RepID=A0A1D6HAR3_MAIZE|nr:monooxygenase 1 [Zea mays]
MAKNIPAGSIRFGCHVVAIQQDPGTHGPILTTVDGGTIRAKVLIGCDGGSSAVARYLGLSPPKAIPRTVLRGFTAYPHGHPFGAEFLRIRGGGEFVVGRNNARHQRRERHDDEGFHAGEAARLLRSRDRPDGPGLGPRVPQRREQHPVPVSVAGRARRLPQGRRHGRRRRHARHGPVHRPGRLGGARGRRRARPLDVTGQRRRRRSRCRGSGVRPGEEAQGGAAVSRELCRGDAAAR